MTFRIIAICMITSVAHAERSTGSTPGVARCTTSRTGGQLSSDSVRFSIQQEQNAIHPGVVENRLDGTSIPPPKELFVLKFSDGQTLEASALRVEKALRCSALIPKAHAARAAERRAGLMLSARLVDPTHHVSVLWSAQLRDGTHYVRQLIHIESTENLALERVTLFDLALDEATVAGTVEGAPLITSHGFLGIEHPTATTRVIAGRATAWIARKLPLHAGVAADYSSVIGITAPGQVRRGFQDYLALERAHPYRSFLHYNSWYDIGYFTPYTADEARQVIERFGVELVTRRNTPMASFLFDDGWDDPTHLWQFNAGFPEGFQPLTEATKAYHAAPGVWLSPWGGYGAPRKARLAAAAAQGLESDSEGLALSGPRYYALFHDTTMRLLSEGINQFKLDGLGSPDKVTAGSAFDSDYAAALSLIDDLRQKSPELYINLTTGTWPSPFWLRSVDSIWRGGEDHAFLGTGPDRERWITYRDADTYGGIVRQSPLYPLNALMLHGVIYARHAEGLSTDPSHALAHEVWSYFATGTGLQELYVSADLLSADDWDLIASAARWSQSHAEILQDSHWLGGDPARAQVYGFGSWRNDRAVIALRNPSDRPQQFELDLASALELPTGAARHFSATAAYGRAPPDELVATPSITVALEPFEVLVWDLTGTH